MSTGKVKIKSWSELFEENRIRQEIEIVQEAAEAVLRGTYHAVVVSGPPGIGKNHIFNELFLKHGNEYVLASPVSNTGLMETLYSAGTSIVMFDDCDSIWRADTAGTWKKALDPVPFNRTLVHNIKPEFAINGGRPFKVKCRSVFLSNKDLRDERQFPKSMIPHMKAITSRIPVYTISFDLRDMWEYTCSLIITKGLLRETDPHFSLAQANHTLAYLTATAHKKGDASPRYALEIAKAIKAHPKTWNRVLDMRLPPQRLWGKTGVQAAREAVPEIVIPTKVQRKAA